MKRILITACIAAILLCMGCGWAEIMQLPAGLTAIEEQAFMGDTALDEIILPDDMQSIGSQAFADSSLRIVRGTDISEIEIAQDAFGDEGVFYFPFEGNSLTIGRGQDMLLPITLLPKNTNEGITYSSSDSAVASVNDWGKISGLKVGNAVITLENDFGVSVSLNVTVDNYAAVNDYDVVAHRGASGYKRENSIAAFEYAASLGADMIELDVRKTSDGKTVCHHDANLKVGGKSYNVEKQTLAKLKQLNSDLCSLDEALAAIEKTDCTLQIEFKSHGLEQIAIDLVEKYNMTDRVCYGSFDKAVLDVVKWLDPTAKAVCITNDSTVVNHLMNGTGSYNVEVASVRNDLLNETNIFRLHQAGLEVYVWTLDDAATIQKYIGWGVDGVITNYPDRAM